jgi:hypothetical protein
MCLWGIEEYLYPDALPLGWKTDRCDCVCVYMNVNVYVCMCLWGIEEYLYPALAGKLTRCDSLCVCVYIYILGILFKNSQKHVTFADSQVHIPQVDSQKKVSRNMSLLQTHKSTFHK